MPIDPETGLWVRDDKANPGDVGAQQDAPVDPPRMSFVQQDPTVITANEPPPEAPGVPAPDVLPQAPPGLPQVQPYQPQAVPPIPTSKTVSPAEAQNLGAIDQNTIDRMQTAQQGGQVKTAAAESQLAAASRDQYATEGQQADHERIAQEFAQRLQEREQQANADYAKYKSFGIKDPQAEDSFATRILKAIAIGMGAYASGMNGGQNQALSIIQQANKDNIDRQKAQQEKLFQLAERSGKDVEAAKRERDEAFRQLDLKHAALLDSSAQQLKTELARIGVPEAQIAANKDLQTIQKDALDLREKNLTSIRGDETDLAKAEMAAAARKAKAAKGGGGGGNLDGMAQLATYAQQHPGDNPGLYQLAAKLGLKAKDVSQAINQNKVTEGAGKDAGQGAIALRAIDSIEKSNYTPSREDIQKWMNNQRDVARAQQMSEGKGIGGALSSGLAGLAQRKGVLAQNEFDGLPKEAREYFTNVRRYMETIGRVQSGAAISNSEWQNFYGQYGPQSSGGLEGARQFAADRFKMSGVAGRVLDKQSPVPVEKSAGARGEDPRVGLARKAISDPGASPAVKARALQILRSLNQADTL